MAAAQLKLISVSNKFHKKVRLLAAFEEKQLKEIADKFLLPVIERRIATHMANGKGKR